VSKKSAFIYALLFISSRGAAAIYLNPESLIVLFIAAATITFIQVLQKGVLS